MGCKIAGAGKALPQRVVTNDELANLVDTSDEWIVTRTGIHERRIALEETSTDLAEQAALRALVQAQITAEDIDLIICMTITPDAIIPAQSCLVKSRLGATNAVAFDLNAACTGCIYGIDVASTMLQASALARSVAQAGTEESAAGTSVTAATAANTPASSDRLGVLSRNDMRRALVIGVERLSRIVDWDDRATCVLFGDGAGAVVLEWDDDAPGIKSSFLKNTDDDTLSLASAHLYDVSSFPFEQLTQTGRMQAMVEENTTRVERAMVQSAEEGSETPLDTRLLERPSISMQGQRVFKFATAAMVEAIDEVLARAGVSIDDVSCIVPHQANERIIKYAAKKIGKPLDLFQVSISSVGNTSASSVLMALADAYEAGRIKEQDIVILVGFGGGLTSGALLFEA